MSVGWKNNPGVSLDIAEIGDAPTSNKGAVISPCGRYRYRLWRAWDASKPVLVFVMLNPSTADASADDPTIRKCIGFAKLHGFGGIEVVNLFAWRATDPKDMRRAFKAATAKARLASDVMAGALPEIVGPENERFLQHAAALDGATVVYAWGTHASDYPFRCINVKNVLYGIIFRRGSHPKCLGYTTKSRQPRHPLMVSYATPLEAYVR